MTYYIRKGMVCKMNEMMNCPGCGKSIKSSSRFCGFCGTKFDVSDTVEDVYPGYLVAVPEMPADDSIVCAVCGFSLKPNSKFCGKCGSNVDFEATVSVIDSPVIDEVDGAVVLPEDVSEPIGDMCVSCGNHLKPGAKFCGKCGSSVDFEATVSGYIPGVDVMPPVTLDYSGDSGVIPPGFRPATDDDLK